MDNSKTTKWPTVLGQMTRRQQTSAYIDSVQCTQCGKRPFSDRRLAAWHCSATISIKSANVTGVLVMELARCYLVWLAGSMQRQSHVPFIHSSSSVRTRNSITEIETRVWCSYENRTVWAQGH